METTDNEKTELEVLTPDQLKEKGNECVKKLNFPQAIRFYSQAIREATNDSSDIHHILYSNRSLAYLKNKEYYYALADAEKTIELAPNFVKVC